MRRGTLSLGKAVTRFFLVSIAPVGLYMLAFFLAVAIEEISGVPGVVEGYARSLLPVLVIGITWVLLMTVAIAILGMFKRGKRT